MVFFGYVIFSGYKDGEMRGLVGREDGGEGFKTIWGLRDTGDGVTVPVPTTTHPYPPSTKII